MTLETALALASTLSQAVVIGLIVFRRIYKTLPLFSSYLVLFLIVDGVNSYVGQYHPRIYAQFYLAEDIIEVIFIFGVVVELSMSVLKPIRASLPRWSFLAIGTVFVLVFAVIWPFATPPGLTKAVSLSYRMIFHIDIATSALQIVFFLAMAGFSQLLSIGWRDRELQIATALGFYSLVSLSVTLLHMNQGIGNAALSRQYHMLDELVAASYICSMVYLIVSFAQKVPERREFTPQMQSLLLAVAGSARATRIAMTNSSEATASGRRTRD